MNEYSDLGLEVCAVSGVGAGGGVEADGEASLSDEDSVPLSVFTARLVVSS